MTSLLLLTVMDSAVFRVASVAGVGRCAVAARDIAAGEVVLEDEAMVVAPGGGRRLCLECGGALPEDTCCPVPGCGLPVCCSGPRHQEQRTVTISILNIYLHLPQLETLYMIYLHNSA